MKPKSLLMFSGGIDKQHRAVMGLKCLYKKGENFLKNLREKYLIWKTLDGHYNNKNVIY